MARRDGYSRGLESLEEIRASDRFIEQLRVSGTYEPSTRADAALASALLTWRDEARLEPLNPPPSADEVDLDVYAQPRRIARRAVAVAATMLALSSAAATALDGDPLKPVRFLVDLGVNVGERIGHPSSDPSSAEGVDTPKITSSGSEDGTGDSGGLWEQIQRDAVKDPSLGAPTPDVMPTAPQAGTEPAPTIDPANPVPTDDGTAPTDDPTAEQTPDQPSATGTDPTNDPGQSPDPGQGSDDQSQSTEEPPTTDSGGDSGSDPQGGVVDGGLDGGGPVTTPDPGPGGGGDGNNGNPDANSGTDANTSNDGGPPPPVTSPDDPPANPPGNPENQGDGNGGNGQGGGDQNGNGDGSQSAQDSFDYHGTWPLSGLGPYDFFQFDHPGNSEKSQGHGHAYGHFFKQLDKHDRTMLKKYAHLNKHEIRAFKRHLDKHQRVLFNRYLRQVGYTDASWGRFSYRSVTWRDR